MTRLVDLWIREDAGGADGGSLETLERSLVTRFLFSGGGAHAGGAAEVAAATGFARALGDMGALPLAAFFAARIPEADPAGGDAAAEAGREAHVLRERLLRACSQEELALPGETGDGKRRSEGG